PQIGGEQPGRLAGEVGTGFEEQHAPPALGQSRRGDRSGRAGADHDDVRRGRPPARGTAQSIDSMPPIIWVIWLTTPGWVRTFTTAGLPESMARRMAGATSPASSTRSAWPPKA